MEETKQNKTILRYVQKPEDEELNFDLLATASSAKWNHILIFFPPVIQGINHKD